MSEQLILLGEIKGKLDMVISGQNSLTTKIDGFEARVSAVEVKGAKNGMITGAVAAVGIDLIKKQLGM